MSSIGFPVGTIVAFVLLAAAVWLYDVLRCKQAHGEIGLREAVMRSVLYVAVALVFAGYLWVAHGSNPASLFLAGYIMEKVLSVDNLMVFAALFTYFRVAESEQHWILQYGFAGAIVFRLIFVTVGVGSLVVFGPIVEVVFGLMVAWSAWALYHATDDGEEEDYGNTWYVRFARKMSMRPEFVCLASIELADVVFAFDSVPVVIAITQDPLLVFSAMIFAILGLRAMYFVLSALRGYLVHLDKAVIVVLLFIAGKLIGHALWGWHLSPVVSCSIVLFILAIGVLASRGELDAQGEISR